VPKHVQLPCIKSVKELLNFPVHTMPPLRALLVP
jgi:hypothetical protein